MAPQHDTGGRRRHMSAAGKTRPMLREVPYTGVIRVFTEAAQLGYHSDHPDWCNLGQGQPEVGPLPGAPDRLRELIVDPQDHAYAPVAGLDALRAAVAEHYNRTYRDGRASQYSAENVAITPGGRDALARVFVALEPHAVGCCSPDYPAYVDLFRFVGEATICPIQLSPDTGFALTPETLRERSRAGDLSLFLLSNPCNPTGRVIRGPELASWLDVSRSTGCALMLDEHYSHFTYDGEGPVSIAQHVDDVDEDPVLLFDGLTKSFRYPGWRIGWVVGPRKLIDTVVSVGSFLDGGASRLVQRAAIELLAPEMARRETEAIRVAFAQKRDLTVGSLLAMGFDLPYQPEGALYAFPSVGRLPAPLNTGRGLFEAALRERVITVPGHYFDMARGTAREGASVYDGFVRISFGAPTSELEDGLNRLARLIDRHAGRSPTSRARGAASR